MQWFIYTQGDVSGPFTLHEMRALAREARLEKTSQTTRRGSPEWKRASEDVVLKPLFSGTEGRPHPSGSPAPERVAPPRLVVQPRPTGAAEDIDPSPGTGKPAHRDRSKSVVAEVSGTASGSPESSQGIDPKPQDKEIPHRGGPGPIAQARPPNEGASSPSALAAIPATVVPAATRKINALRHDPPTDAHWRHRDEDSDPHPVSSGIASLFLPGFGQFLNGEFLKGIAFGLAAIVFWAASLGWVIHVWAAIHASRRADIIADERQKIRKNSYRQAARNE
ncbi:DUF4339 domain-containing protein [Pararhodobacter sp. SW119]|uniref:DUF4339 domain-containing protein n=1 Tax=Pararhodobacter sp. SW119 TaxID=2780075 RepID=UPI001ADF6439|nr:DUF4339 domain-containing protein [Pararhodobacter sp. SW119]